MSEDYTPIMIPTLCRYEHFRRCLESLQRCAHANETDVYVGLDYPAKESHWDGYKKIDAYLQTVTGFRNLYVFRREKNFGAKENSRDLISKIRDKSDSYIYMEDDLEVSPNYLDYLHKGKLKFREDANVFAICGYSHRNDLNCGDSNYYHQDVMFSAWGYLIMFSQRDKFLRKLSRWYSIRKLINPISLWKSVHSSWSSLLFLLMHAINPQLLIDQVISNYLLFEHLNVIAPAKSLVRNHGFDSSGEHCYSVGAYAEAEIDKKELFEFTGNGYDNEAEIHKILLSDKRQYMSFRKMLGHIRAMVMVRVKRVIGIA